MNTISVAIRHIMSKYYNLIQFQLNLFHSPHQHYTTKITLTLAHIQEIG